MDINYDINTTSNIGDINGQGIDGKEGLGIGIAVGSAGILFGIVQWIRARKYKRMYKKTLKQNEEFKAIIIKHQAEIDALKRKKDKNDYKYKLWVEYMIKSGAVNEEELIK